MAHLPRVWLLLGDKPGDNAQVHTLARALPWPVESKTVRWRPPFDQAKPPVRASLAHVDPARSDPLTPPWPDLLITIGRRPANAALWVRRQSGGRTKVVLLGKPSGLDAQFDLIIHSAEIQIPPLVNVLSITLPLMDVDRDEIAAAAAAWESRLRPLPRPLVAVLIGGPTIPFVYDDTVADRLLALAQAILEQGGTPYLVTSRRTPEPLVRRVRGGLPAGARLFDWSMDGGANPYKALLGLADGFVVTGDSVSMQVEVVRLGKPLGLFSLPYGPLGRLDQVRRRLASWLFAPRTNGSGGRLRWGLAMLCYHAHLVTHTRDFTAFQRMLVAQGLAHPVEQGYGLLPPKGQPPNDLGIVVARLQHMLGAAGV